MPPVEPVEPAPTNSTPLPGNPATGIGGFFGGVVGFFGGGLALLGGTVAAGGEGALRGVIGAGAELLVLQRRPESWRRPKCTEYPIHSPGGSPLSPGPPRVPLVMPRIAA
jgi:hypothetical protein